MKSKMASIYAKLGTFIGKKITIEEIKNMLEENECFILENTYKKTIGFYGIKLNYIIFDGSENQDYDESGNSKSGLIYFQYDGFEIKNILSV